MAGLRQRLRGAAINRVDGFVLRRAAELLRRAQQGAGRDPDGVRAMLASVTSDHPDPAYVEAIAPAFRGAWDRTTGDPNPALRDAIIEHFARLYYNQPARTWRNTRYRGLPIAKCPLDLWIYHELVQEIRPDVIIEAGTNAGGSALYLADQCDLVGNGLVVTIDIEDLASDVKHDRLVKQIGSTTDPAIHAEVLTHVPDGASVMVILDSDHSYAHVSDELRMWARNVTPESYLIVEDTDINGHPVLPSFGPGPWEAVRDFLAEDDRFVVDDGREKYMFTQNPGGYLRCMTR
jgi:cephalosporin hydroxylase